MTPRLKVLILHPPAMRDPWTPDVFRAVDGRHDIVFYDPKAPLGPQIQGVGAVVDPGSGGTHEMADQASSVKLWQILSTGFEGFDLDYWKAKGIPVANTPGQFSGPALGETVMMHILMLSRGWHEMQANVRRQARLLPIGQELEGRRLLILGFGGSGRELARRASGFGMLLSAIEIRKVPQKERRQFGLEAVGKPAELDRMLPECDFLSLHLHLNSETRHVIDRRRLGLLKPTAYLINVARAELVDEEALQEALSQGRLAGAGLDVFNREPVDPNHPLLQLSNVVATPHIAGVTVETSRRRAGCVAENLDRVAAGQEPLYRIDL